MLIWWTHVKRGRWDLRWRVRVEPGGRVRVEPGGDALIRSTCKLTHVGPKQYAKGSHEPYALSIPV
jgi:hypothetical protein